MGSGDALPRGIDVIGQTIKHYHIHERLGEGAMGVVYRAYDDALEREVAVKFLSSGAAPGPEAVERFYREARAAAGLSHPNVVVIHDIGEHEEACYFVMELLEGASLRKTMAGGGRPDWQECLGIVTQVCRALEAAHAKGLLHRDIKPDNIWLAPGGLVKVLDFGIARISQGEALTQAGETPGTPEYMAPEQIMGEDLDGRTDLYALGILMYELFTGQLPFTGPSPVTVIYKQIEEEPTPPRHLCADLSPDVEKAILRAISKDPDGRFASAAQMREALEAVLAGGDAAGQEEAERRAEPEPSRPAARGRSRGFECSLVGREAELEGLRSAIRALDEARGTTVLLAGEAGVGKTRLALETAAYARRRGALTLSGSCLYSEGAEPYLPFLEALGHTLDPADEAERERVLAFIREEAPELLELTTHLMTVIRTLRVTGMGTQEETIATSKERLFEAITQVLLFLSREAPVVLLLEDLQWADSGSLQLLHYIARSAANQRLLVLGTYRTEELLPDVDGSSHPLTDTLQRMSAEGICQKIELAGLAPDALNTMLRRIFRRAMFSPEFRASLHRETGGNPLFVVEVLKLLRDEGGIYEQRGTWRERREVAFDAIPERVYDVVLRRIERLSEDQRELLQVAATVGDRFTSAALSEVSECERVPVLRTLNRLERVHQLIRSEGDGYAFTHAKIREALYTEIPPELQREYHLAYGAFLEAHATPGGRAAVSDLARHFHLGGASSRALPYLVQAGDRASRMFAYKEAAEFYRWAVADLSTLAAKRRPRGLEASLLTRFGGVCSRLGDRQGALRLLQEAERRAEEEDDGGTVGKVRQKIGKIHYSAGDYDAARRQYRRSAERLAEAGDKRALCGVLLDAAMIPFQQGDWSRARFLYSRVLRIARQTKDRRRIATVRMNTGIMASIQGVTDRALKLYDRSRPLFEESSDWTRLSQVWINQGKTRAVRREWDEATKAYDQALKIARRIRDIHLEAQCHLNLAEVMLERSELKRSRRACLKALDIFRRIGKRMSVAESLKTLGQVAALRREWDDAERYFRESISINESLRHPLYAGGAHLEFARMLKAKGDLEEAAHEAQRSVSFFEEIDASEELNRAEALRAEVEALLEVSCA